MEISTKYSRQVLHFSSSFVVLLSTFTAFSCFKKTKERKKTRASERAKEREEKMSIVVYCLLFISNHHNDDKATSSTFDASLCSLHLIHRHLASALCLANRSCLRAVRGDHLDCVFSSHSTNASGVFDTMETPIASSSFDRIEHQSKFYARTRPSRSHNPANRRSASNKSATLSKGELLLFDIEHWSHWSSFRRWHRRTRRSRAVISIRNSLKLSSTSAWAKRSSKNYHKWSTRPKWTKMFSRNQQWAKLLDRSRRILRSHRSPSQLGVNRLHEHRVHLGR